MMFNVVPSTIVFVEGGVLDVSCMHSHLVLCTHKTHAGASLVLPVNIT